MSKQTAIQEALAQLKSSCGLPHRAAVVFGCGASQHTTANYITHRNLEVCMSVRITPPVRVAQLLLQFGIEIVPDDRVREKYTVARRFDTAAQMVIFDSPQLFAYIQSPWPVATSIITIATILAKGGLHCAIPAWKAETIKPAGVAVFETIADIENLSQLAHGMRVKEAKALNKNSFKPYSGRIPFGWRKNGDALEVDFNQLKVVSDMKKLQTSGKNYNDIAFYLNMKGIPPATGQGRWSRQTVRAILARYNTDYASLVSEIAGMGTAEDGNNSN